MPQGIKPLKAGPAYKPSKERLLRDQIKSFLGEPTMVEQCNEKLFKVLAPELGQGFTKADLAEFVTFMEKECNFPIPMLSEADMHKQLKESGINEGKNQKPAMVKVIDGLLHKQLDKNEAILASNPKL